MDSGMVITRVEVSELVEPESSNIVAIGYDDDSQKAFVAFKNGTLYQYLDVKRELFDDLRDAKSVGKHLQGVFLKEGFSYEKLERTEIYLKEE